MQVYASACLILTSVKSQVLNPVVGTVGSCIDTTVDALVSVSRVAFRVLSTGVKRVSRLLVKLAQAAWKVSVRVGDAVVSVYDAYLHPVVLALGRTARRVGVKIYRVLAAISKRMYDVAKTVVQRVVVPVLRFLRDRALNLLALAKRVAVAMADVVGRIWQASRRRAALIWRSVRDAITTAASHTYRVIRSVLSTVYRVLAAISKRMYDVAKTVVQLVVVPVLRFVRDRAVDLLNACKRLAGMLKTGFLHLWRGFLVPVLRFVSRVLLFTGRIGRDVLLRVVLVAIIFTWPTLTAAAAARFGLNARNLASHPDTTHNYEILVSLLCPSVEQSMRGCCLVRQRLILTSVVYSTLTRH